MLMTCTDAIPSIQPSWLPGMSNFPSFLKSFACHDRQVGFQNAFSWDSWGHTSIQVAIEAETSFEISLDACWGLVHHNKDAGLPQKEQGIDKLSYHTGHNIVIVD